MNIKKIISIIVAIVVVYMIFAVLIHIQIWRTYKNDKYHFTLTYHTSLLSFIFPATSTNAGLDAGEVERYQLPLSHFKISVVKNTFGFEEFGGGVSRVGGGCDKLKTAGEYSLYICAQSGAWEEIQKFPPQ